MDKSWRASNPNHKQSTQVGGGQGTASETPQPHHCPRLGWLAVAARAQRAPEPFCLNHHFAFAQSCRGRAQRHSAINGSPRAAPLMTLSSPNTLEPGDSSSRSSSSLSPSLPPLKITVALQSRLRGEREERVVWCGDGEAAAAAGRRGAVARGGWWCGDGVVVGGSGGPGAFTELRQGGVAGDQPGAGLQLLPEELPQRGLHRPQRHLGAGRRQPGPSRPSPPPPLP